MTPQSSFMVVAPIESGREAELRRLLASMNVTPGVVDPNNALVAFAQYDTLHFARIFILDDRTLEDVEAYGLTRRTYPLSLIFLGDVDGDGRAFIAELVARSTAGLRALFSCCAGFTTQTDLARWMRQHSVAPATMYVNWKGRTVQRIREEAALCEALERYLDQNAASIASGTPSQIHSALRHWVSREIAAARLAMTPEAPTPLGWWLRDVAHLLGIPALLLVTSPLLIVLGAVLLLRIRAHERTDPEICYRVDAAYADALAVLEDHQVANQFTAVGSLKPGVVRRWVAAFVLWFIDYTTRHIYTRGRLARVHTIHFARWVWLDRKERLLFASNYDGSLDSYMDDFINKVAFGLNVVFSNGIGYPRTRWLIEDGAKDEQKFKYYLRRHELPTEVWYSANPGLTAVDLERNGRIRAGLEAPSLTDTEAREWLMLL